jgi:hypothetical protein
MVVEINYVLIVISMIWLVKIVHVVVELVKMWFEGVVTENHWEQK